MKLFGFRIARISTLEKEQYNALEDYKWRSREVAEREFRENGYTEWAHKNPPNDREFLLIRSGWYWPQLTSVAETSPYMNTVGAFWKLNDNSSVRPTPETLSAYIQ